MKKSSRAKSQNRKKARKSDPDTTLQAAEPSRRDLLGKARNWGIGLAIAGGAGLGVTRMVRSTAHAHDLTRVANGRPTVVQVHDPQCTLCVALQRETKRALKAFDDQQLDYVIANITSAKGRAFAGRYGVSHVTLLLFDGSGALQQVLHGQHDDSELQEAFTALLES
ncbi:MAG: hypothetical protein AAGF32_09765 [Pseudomonadota bacterium]